MRTTKEIRATSWPAVVIVRLLTKLQKGEHLLMRNLYKSHWIIASIFVIFGLILPLPHSFEKKKFICVFHAVLHMWLRYIIKVAMYMCKNVPKRFLS